MLEYYCSTAHNWILVWTSIYCINQVQPLCLEELAMHEGALQSVLEHLLIAMTLCSASFHLHPCKCYSPATSHTARKHTVHFSKCSYNHSNFGILRAKVADKIKEYIRERVQWKWLHLVNYWDWSRILCTQFACLRFSFFLMTPGCLFANNFPFEVNMKLTNAFLF